MNPEAYSLIDRAKDLDNPTADEHMRVRQALGVALASAGAVGTVGTTAAAAKAATTTGALKLGMFGAWASSKAVLWASVGVVTGLVGWGTVELASDPPRTDAPSSSAGGDPVGFSASPSPASPHALSHRASTSPRGRSDGAPSTREEAPNGARPEETQANSEQAAAVASPGSTPPPSSMSAQPGLAEVRWVEPAPPGSEPPVASPPNEESTSPTEHTRPTEHTLREELVLIRGAQAALGRGDPGEALQQLREHERRFPTGVLTEERLAGQALAECALGRTTAAKSTIRRFRRESLHSPLWDRVAEECGIGQE